MFYLNNQIPNAFSNQGISPHSLSIAKFILSHSDLTPAQKLLIQTVFFKLQRTNNITQDYQNFYTQLREAAKEDSNLLQILAHCNNQIAGHIHQTVQPTFQQTSPSTQHPPQSRIGQSHDFRAIANFIHSQPSFTQDQRDLINNLFEITLRTNNLKQDYQNFYRTLQQLRKQDSDFLSILEFCNEHIIEYFNQTVQPNFQQTSSLPQHPFQWSIRLSSSSHRPQTNIGQNFSSDQQTYRITYGQNSPVTHSNQVVNNFNQNTYQNTSRMTSSNQMMTNSNQNYSNQSSSFNFQNVYQVNPSQRNTPLPINNQNSSGIPQVMTNPVFDELQRRTTMIPFDFLRIPSHFIDISCPSETAVKVFQGDHMEWIHANHVGQNISLVEYIVSGAPGYGNISQFWNATQQYNVSLIVDLTNEKDFAPPYCPTEVGVQSQSGGFMQVTLETVRHRGNDYTEYSYKVINQQENRETMITRMCYTGWVDQKGMDCIKFCELIQTTKQIYATKSPKSKIWVHCRGGVGRSGTFVAGLIVDEKIKANHIQNDFTENLVNLIVSLRAQRGPGLVNNADQFNLLMNYVYLAYKEFHKVY